LTPLPHTHPPGIPVNDNQSSTGLTTSSDPTNNTDAPLAEITPSILCRDVSRSDSPSPTTLPRDECCRGLSGDALCVPCNAGPLSLSAYPPSFTSQTADTDLPRSNHLQPYLTPTDSTMSLPNKPPPSGSVHPYNTIEGTFGTPWNAVLYPPLMPLQSIHELPVHKASSSMTLPTPLPLLIAGSTLALSLLPTPSEGLTFTRCPNIVSDKLVLVKMPRDECCRGLPGDALCVPCNAGPLSLSATSKRMVYQLGPATTTVLLLPREECCRDLPGGALSTPCNAGPLSLSAYPQSSITQTVDPDMLSSIHVRTHLLATTCPTPSPTAFPAPLKDSFCLYHKILSMHAQKVPLCMTHAPRLSPPPARSMLSTPSSPTSLLEEGTTRDVCLSDSLSTKTLPRDECCRQFL
jgi:hypothetical protein